MGVFDFLFRKRNQRRATWAKVADELGGGFHLGTGVFRRKNERIEVVVRDVPVVLETYTVQVGDAAMPYMRVSAPFTRGPGPELEVYEPNILSKVGRALGAQDVVLGDATFDETFMVKAENPAVARRLWSDTAMRALLRSFTNARVKIESNAETIRLIAPGLWDDEHTLRAAIALITELAGRDLFGIEALRAIEHATFAQEPGRWPHAVIDAQTRVVIQAEHPGDVLVMVARVREPGEREPLVLDVVDGAPADAATAARLPQGAHVPLHDVGSGTLAIDGDGLRFTWTTLELDPARLRAGAELLGAAAAGQGALFR